MVIKIIMFIDWLLKCLFMQNWTRALPKIMAIGGFFSDHRMSYRELNEGKNLFHALTWLVDQTVPQCAYR